MLWHLDVLFKQARLLGQNMFRSRDKLGINVWNCFFRSANFSLQFPNSDCFMLLKFSQNKIIWELNINTLIHVINRYFPNINTFLKKTLKHQNKSHWHFHLCECLPILNKHLCLYLRSARLRQNILMKVYERLLINAFMSSNSTILSWLYSSLA